ncbi:MAG: hypothetical protein INR71_00755, partial [Terriglobus roseus]|nr:hypothetical protein [Terriglobus roseus]
MPSSASPHSRKASLDAGFENPAGHVPVSFFLASEHDVNSAVARQDTREQQQHHHHQHDGGADRGSPDRGGKPRELVEEADDAGDKQGSLGVQSIEQALSDAFGLGADTIKAKPLSRSGSGKSRSGDAATEAGKKRKRKGHAAEVEAGDELAVSGTDTPRHDAAGSVHSSPQPPVKTASGHLRRLSNAMASAPLTPINIESPAYHADSTVPSTPNSVSLRSLRLSDDGEHDDAMLNDNASQAIASTDDEDD